MATSEGGIPKSSTTNRTELTESDLEFLNDIWWDLMTRFSARLDQVDQALNRVVTDYIYIADALDESAINASAAPLGYDRDVVIATPSSTTNGGHALPMLVLLFTFAAFVLLYRRL